MRRKRILTLMFLFVFAFTMLPAAKVMATDKTGTITMLNADGGAVRDQSEYAAYQIVTFDTSKEAGNHIVYTNMKINPIYKSVILSASGLTGSPTDYDILTKITELASDPKKIQQLAVDLKQVIPSGSQVYTADKGVFKDLKYGYYLVIETANQAVDGEVISKPILVGVPGSSDGADCVKVCVKTSKAGIVKKIVENGLYDTSTAAVEEVIQYQSKSDIPTYAANATGIKYFVTDTFSTGLTYNSDQGIEAKIVDTAGTVIKPLQENTDYTLDISIPFKLTLVNDNDIKNWSDAGYKLLITYSATLNSKAITGEVGNPNTIELTYSTNPGTNETYETSDTVITYTNQLEVIKTDSSVISNPLKDAKFELYRNIGTVGNEEWVKIGDTQVTGDNGKIYFNKLEQGTYKLVEVEAPSGYNLSDPEIFNVTAYNNTNIPIPKDSIIVTATNNEAAKSFKATWSCDNTKISVNNDMLSIKIVNTKGFTLPGTGGIGTTIFTVVGIAIILMGCCMCLIYFKKREHSGSAKPGTMRVTQK